MNAFEVDHPLHGTETMVQANWAVIFIMAHAWEPTGKHTLISRCVRKQPVLPAANDASVIDQVIPSSKRVTESL